MGSKSFTQLKVWELAHQVTLEVYRVTAAFPADERFCLVTQMRRAAISVPANIAEGFGRRGPQDKARFYTIGQASAEELKYFLILARDLGYLKDPVDLQKNLDSVCSMLCRLIEAVLSDLRRAP